MSQKPSAAQKKALLIKLAVVAVVLAVGAVLVVRGLDLRALLDDTLALVRAYGPWVFFSAIAVLPAVGFPLSAFWLAAGPVFAPVIGMPMVLLCSGIALGINLALTYWLARYAFRPPLAWMVGRLGYSLPQIPPSERVTVSVLVRVTPGPPFFVQSYLLGLAGVPFRTYMLVSWPIAMAFGAIFIFFGDSLAQGEGKLALLAFGGLLALGGGFKFLRRRMLKKKQAPALVAQVAASTIEESR
jgi:uncharacterized membrane protein YdjX (TVP38/TMEM64 family)